MSASNAATVDFHAVRAAVLCEIPGVRLLYVFGSCGRGTARVGSDLDLAILADAPVDPVQLFAARQSVELALGVDVDLVDLAVASSVLRLEIIRDGKLLHRRSAEQALEFEARVLGEYAELMEATRLLRADIRRRGTVYAT